jgi:3D (Asp-Asp-Asp) domain-containing protein
MMKSLRPLAIAVLFLLAGCAQNAEMTSVHPPAKRATAGTRVTVRTTAYTESEAGHRLYGKHNALGEELKDGDVRSAAADWSRFPLGTKFRIVDNNSSYVIDDYGSALVGSNTIDLYMPSKRLMNHWGTRNVTIEITEQGSYPMSLMLLRPRKGSSHVRRMIQSIEEKTKGESAT